MTNWDDWIYIGDYDDERKRPKYKYLKFCLNCGPNRNVPGDRYRVSGAVEYGLLLDNAVEHECPNCKFPVFTGRTYKQVFKIKARPKSY